MGSDESKPARPMDTCQKSTRSKYSEVITVLVGSSKEKFSVHEDMICKTSEFFKTIMISKEWKESNERQVEMPEQHQTAFQIYLESIYNPSTDVCAMVEGYLDQLLRSEEEIHNLDSCQRYGLALLKLSTLGDYIDDAYFKELVMRGGFDAYRRGEWAFSEAAMKIAFECLPSVNGMHMFCADWLAAVMKARSSTSSDLDFDKLKESMSPSCVEPWLKATLMAREMKLDNYLATQD